MRIHKALPISGMIRTCVSDILRPLSPIQQITCASATYFFLFTIASDVATSFLAPLISIVGIVVGFPVALALTSVGVILPCYILSRFYSEVRKPKEQKRGPLHTASVVVLVLKGIVALVALTFLIMMLFITEFIFPITALPFITTTAAFLWIHVAKGTLGHIPVSQRHALIALFVILILSVRYVDWNTRKPFARHLFQIHRGMTGAEVERIMRSHLKNWVQPESEHYLHLDPTFTGEVWYRHTTKGWGNSDWGKVVMKDGRAVDAEICLCD